MGLFSRKSSAPEPTNAEKSHDHFVAGADAQKRFTSEPTTQGRLAALNEYSSHADAQRRLAEGK